MYEGILVATDGSEGAREAIEEAVGLAELTGATLHGVYVVDTRTYSALPESKWITLESELENIGTNALEDVAEAAQEADVQVVTSIERGVPHEAILEYVEAAGIDLIVAGTHGRSGVDRLLIGSVTEKLLRQANVPVHVVRVPNEG
ncbi:MAG: universal stress protein [Halodesulfurarchaeum sp.]